MSDETTPEPEASEESKPCRRSRPLGAGARTRDSDRAKSGKARQAKSVGSKGKRGPKPAKDKADKSLDRYASLRARAREVNHTDKAARIRFMAELGTEYERGVTPAVLADVWGMKLATVETDASIAGLLIKLQADPEVAHAVYWQDVYAELELMQPLRKRAAEVLQEGLDSKLYERIPDGDGGDMLAVVSPRGMKELSEALSELAQATDRCRDKIGKASGLLTSGTTINLTAVLAAAVRVEAVDADAKVSTLLECVEQALEAFDKSKDPATRLAGVALLERLTGRQLVPALPSPPEITQPKED